MEGPLHNLANSGGTLDGAPLVRTMAPLLMFRSRWQHRWSLLPCGAMWADPAMVTSQTPTAKNTRSGLNQCWEGSGEKETPLECTTHRNQPYHNQPLHTMVKATVMTVTTMSMTE